MRGLGLRRFRRSSWGADNMLSFRRVIVGSLACLLFMTITTGCASGYWIDRGRDAKDVFTCTYGYGAGAKVRVSAVNLGLFANLDARGLRTGKVGPLGTLCDAPFDLILLIRSMERCTTSHLESDRHKTFVSKGLLGIALAGDGTGKDDLEWEVIFPTMRARNIFPKIAFTRSIIPYYTQVEAAAGLGLTLRVGINIGELLDFVLGWTTLDLFGDDIATQQQDAAQKS